MYITHLLLIATILISKQTKRVICPSDKADTDKYLSEHPNYASNHKTLLKGWHVLFMDRNDRCSPHFVSILFSSIFNGNYFESCLLLQKPDGKYCSIKRFLFTIKTSDRTPIAIAIFDVGLKVYLQKKTLQSCSWSKYTVIYCGIRFRW